MIGRMLGGYFIWGTAYLQQTANADADGKRCNQRCRCRQPWDTPRKRALAGRKFAGCAFRVPPGQELIGGIYLGFLAQRGAACLILLAAGINWARCPRMLESLPGFGCTFYIIQKFAQRLPQPGGFVITTSVWSSTTWIGICYLMFAIVMITPRLIMNSAVRHTSTGAASFSLSA